ncbi:MAG: hypothetical protein ACRC4L_00080 [Mycoplasma sp.]
MIKNDVISLSNRKHNYYYIENNYNEHVIVFLNGINGDHNVISLYKNEIFKNNYFLTFDNLSQGDNPAPHTKNYKKYAKFTINFIKELKKEEKFKNKKFIVIAESFGSNIAFLINKMEPDIADLYFCWNAPTKVSSSKVPMKKLIPISLKTMTTLLFNIETYVKTGFSPELTSNPAVLRINKNRIINTSNKLHLAVWRSMYAVRRIAKTGLGKNFVYVQSLNDNMLHNDILKIKSENFHIFKEGKHLLSFEPNANELFALLEAKIKELSI